MTIWIRNAYPFRSEETRAIEEALRKTQGVQAVCIKLWPHEYVTIDNVTMTTAKQVAATLKTMHCYAAINDRRTSSYVFAEDVEVEVRGRLDGFPQWAR